MKKLCILTWLFILISSPEAGIGAPEALETLTLGSAPSLTAVLEIVAEDQGFFKKEGLHVDIRDYPSGKEALEDVLVNKLDVAASTALPVVIQGFERKDYRIIGTVGYLANDNIIVARQDAGLKVVTDLKGKRIGVSPNVMPHYMLDLLLRKYDIASNEVTVVFEPQSQLVIDLVQEKLDAATLLGKYIGQAKSELGTNAICFSDKSLFEITTYVTVHESLVKQRPEVIAKFLKGCLKAERFVEDHPDQCMNIVARRLKMDLDAIRVAWRDCRFVVEFHQAILNDLESKARWQMERQLTTVRTMPNYLEVLYYQGLERIDPQRVTIIH